MYVNLILIAPDWVLILVLNVNLTRSDKKNRVMVSLLVIYFFITKKGNVSIVVIYGLEIL